MSTQRDIDLHHLRILAWCVMRGRDQSEPRRVEGGHRGKARIATFTFYVEMPDFREANEAVRQIIDNRAAHPRPKLTD
ncbi:MAG: hypothetical protein GEU80_17070 [Dehalococcoidia bacterium]|nr:hypothetical protein [Dehalococcoidia bacterium]